MNCFLCKRDLDVFENPSRIIICANMHCSCADCNVKGTSACEECKAPIWRVCRLGSPGSTLATGTKIRCPMENVSGSAGKDSECPRPVVEKEVCNGFVEQRIDNGTVQYCDVATQYPEACKLENLCCALNASPAALRFCGGVDTIVDADASDKKEVETKLDSAATERKVDLRDKCIAAIKEQDAVACDCELFLHEGEKQSSEPSVVHTLVLDTPRLIFSPFPAKCPKCQKIFFPNDFKEHVYYDHDDQGYIHAGVSHQFYLSLAMLCGEKTICLNPYLIQFEQVETSFGQKFDNLPVFINVHQIMISDLIGPPSDKEEFEDKLYGFIVWAAMLAPCNYNFRATLSVWNLKYSEPYLCTSVSRPVQSISESHDLKWQYENSLFISMRAMNSMSKDDNLKFEIQIN